MNSGLSAAVQLQGNIYENKCSPESNGDLDILAGDGLSIHFEGTRADPFKMDMIQILPPAA